MPNIYATPTEIKAAAPDMIQVSTTKYDTLLMRLANTISRQIDAHTGREFYPTSAARIFTPCEESDTLSIPDLLTLTSAEYSTDSSNYTAISTSYIVPQRQGDRNTWASYDELRLIWTSPIGTWPSIPDGVRITGIWAYHDDRAGAWELAGTLSTGCSTGAVSLTVANAGLVDTWRVGAAYQIGRLVKIDSEFFEITNITGNNSLTVKGARNGTTSAAHLTGASLYVWKPCELAKEAVIIEAVKLLERGLQGFANARSTPEMGQPVWEKKLDVQTVEMLSKLNRF